MPSPPLLLPISSVWQNAPVCAPMEWLAGNGNWSRLYAPLYAGCWCDFSARQHIYVERGARYAIARLYVCLSDCPSVTRVHQSKTVEVIILQLSPYSSNPTWITTVWWKLQDYIQHQQFSTLCHTHPYLVVAVVDDVWDFIGVAADRSTPVHCYRRQCVVRLLCVNVHLSLNHHHHHHHHYHHYHCIHNR